MLAYSVLPNLQAPLDSRKFLLNNEERKDQNGELKEPNESAQSMRTKQGDGSAVLLARQKQALQELVLATQGTDGTDLEDKVHSPNPSETVCSPQAVGIEMSQLESPRIHDSNGQAQMPQLSLSLKDVMMPEKSVFLSLPFFLSRILCQSLIRRSACLNFLVCVCLAWVRRSVWSTPSFLACF